MNAPTPDEARTELAALRKLREKAEATQKAATAATEPTVLRALQAKLKPAEIAKLGYVSDGYVRGVRRKHDLPANPSYATLKPPARATAEPAPAAEPTDL